MATVQVRPGDSIQNAINNARPGDRLVIDAGATFPGPVTLPAVSGNGAPISIESSALANLPGVGAWVTPMDAGAMPKIISPGLGESALVTQVGAHHWVLAGIEFLPVDANAFLYDLIRLGEATEAQNTLEAVPHDLVLDRCYIHAWPTQGVKRGVAMNSAQTKITGCYISDFKVQGQDSQAVSCWNGPGPFVIEDCYLEAAGENVMFGGAGTWISGLVPTGITITGCLFYKPLTWKQGHPSYAGTRWTIKNLLEFKSAKDVVVTNCWLENNWADAQSGGGILLTPRGEQNGGPWGCCKNITLANNTLCNSDQGIMIQGSDDLSESGHSENILIQHNHFQNVATGSSSARLFQLTTGASGGIRGLRIEHNTSTGNLTLLYGEGSHTGLVIIDNVLAHGDYGIMAPGVTGGTASLAVMCPEYRFEGNVIPGANERYYGENNWYPSTWEDVGLNEQEELSEASPYCGHATDGTDPGYSATAAPPIKPPPVGPPPTGEAVAVSILIAVPPAIQVGDKESVIGVAVTAADGSVPSGTVSLSYGSFGTFAHQLEADGTTEYTLSSLPVGNYLIQATYPAQGSYAAGASATMPLAVTETEPPDLIPTVTELVLPAGATAGDPLAVVMVAVSAADGSIPTGTVVLYGDPLGDVQRFLDADGSVEISIASWSAGTYMLRASYAAQGPYDSSGTAAVPLLIEPGQSPPPNDWGQLLTQVLDTTRNEMTLRYTDCSGVDHNLTLRLHE